MEVRIWWKWWGCSGGEVMREMEEDVVVSGRRGEGK